MSYNCVTPGPAPKELWNVAIPGDCLDSVAFDADRKRLFMVVYQGKAVHVHSNHSGRRLGVLYDWHGLPQSRLAALTIDDKNKRVLAIDQSWTIHGWSSVSYVYFGVLARCKSRWLDPAHMFCDPIRDLVYISCLQEIMVRSTDDFTRVRNHYIEGGGPTRKLHLGYDEPSEQLTCIDRGVGSIRFLSRPDCSVVLTHKVRGLRSISFGLTQAICADDRGRHFVLSTHVLVAVSAHEGLVIKTMPLPSTGVDLAFDATRGTMTVACSDCVLQFSLLDWLPGGFVWSPFTHHRAGRVLQRQVFTITAIRSLEDTVLSPLPNELLFLLFEHL